MIQIINQQLNLEVSQMKQTADASLLSLLEKISNPITSLAFHLKLNGLYAPPQQWKLTDEANPGMFAYSVDILHMNFASGKIDPRKLTEKELRDIQQSKNKKASKKQSKQQQKPAELDPEAEKRRLEWQALSEEQKFYRTQEDPYKAFSLQWGQKEKQQTFSKQQVEAFENNCNNGFLEIIVTRKPEGNEEEVARIKKSKPKNLNLGELYAAKYKGKLDLTKLNQPGVSKIVQRVPIAYSMEIPPQCIKIESDKSYVLVQIELGEALNPLVEVATPSPRELIKEKPTLDEKPSLLIRLTDEIRKGVRAISQQYANIFAKEKEHTEQKKYSTSNNASLLNVSTLRINQINKRKQQFLQQFVSTGKYALLRERILLTVRAAVIDKCRKEKQGAAVTKQVLQKNLAELNVFFRELLEKTLNECLSSDSSILHQDLVLSHQYTRSARKQTLGIVNQSREDRQVRLANEYETINRVKQAEQKYLNLVLIYGNSIPSLESYALFCLRHGKYDQAFALYNRINEYSKDFKHQLVLSLFKIHRKRQKEAIQLLSKLETSDYISPQEKITIHQLLAFIYQRLSQQKKSEKHVMLAEKYFQMKSNPNLRINAPKNPYIESIPRIPKPGKYISQLSIQESQQIKLSIIQIFINYSFYELANDYLSKLEQGDNKKHIKALVLVGQKKFDQALEFVQTLLEKDPKNMEMLSLKADICFTSERMFQCEEVFLFILKQKPSPNQAYSIYLRLALTYLNRKSWEDAKHIYNKAVELRPNSSQGWLGLGISNLQLGQLKESEEAFNLSSIYNPLSQQVEMYLKKISQTVDSMHRSNYKYFQQEQ